LNTIIYENEEEVKVTDSNTDVENNSKHDADTAFLVDSLTNDAINSQNNTNAIDQLSNITFMMFEALIADEGTTNSDVTTE
jgi:hypothetical protein